MEEYGERCNEIRFVDWIKVRNEEYNLGVVVELADGETELRVY